MLGAGAFDGPERVAALLRAHGIDTSEWGTGLHNKSVVDHLFKELELGETRLEFHLLAASACGGSLSRWPRCASGRPRRAAVDPHRGAAALLRRL